MQEAAKGTAVAADIGFTLCGVHDYTLERHRVI